MSKQKIILIAVAIIVIVVVGIVLSIPKGEKGVEKGEGEETPAAGPGKLPGGEPGPVAEPGEEPIKGEEPGEALPVGPEWQRPEEPMSSPPLEEEEIPKKAVKLVVTAQGFSPDRFEVKKGEEVTLSVTSGDQWTHVFKFKDPSLAATVAVGVAPGETRAITFFAPSEKGEYEFFCDVPGHEGRGEKGVMIVK